MIEFIHGQEWHSSTWEKFYVKGLEKLQAEEEMDGTRRDNHHDYRGYACNAPNGTVFSVWSSCGRKARTEAKMFAICVADTESDSHINGVANGPCYVDGNFRVIVQAETAVKAQRLLGWWMARPQNSDPLEYASRCAKYIGVRGTKILPNE